MKPLKLFIYVFITVCVLGIGFVLLITDMYAWLPFQEFFPSYIIEHSILYHIFELRDFISIAVFISFLLCIAIVIYKGGKGK